MCFFLVVKGLSSKLRTLSQDGCEDPNPPCFPGTECTDQRAPESGHLCGFCPPGYSGNGFVCTPDVEYNRQNQICFDFPETDHGRIMIQNETNGEELSGNANIVRGLIEGEILQYVCDEGYEMIGDNNLKCQPDGTFSGIIIHLSNRL